MAAYDSITVDFDRSLFPFALLWSHGNPLHPQALFPGALGNNAKLPTPNFPQTDIIDPRDHEKDSETVVPGHYYLLTLSSTGTL